MVVGSGLIASNFKHYIDNPDILIFASGVSNSQLTSTLEYERETSLVEQYLDQSALFVYFSSVSVLYPCLQQSQYVQFKLRIEEYILEHFDRSVIFRLPNLVGRTKNPHTLTNFIYDRIQSGAHFEVHANATRYLLDVDDMATICTHLLDSSTTRPLYNIVLNNQTSVFNIVSLLESITGKAGNHTIVDKGCSVDIEPLEYRLSGSSIISSEGMIDYNLNLLRKYYSTAQAV
jgi:nucleoside-diphosphate-sugar epimerase